MERTVLVLVLLTHEPPKSNSQHSDKLKVLSLLNMDLFEEVIKKDEEDLGKRIHYLKRISKMIRPQRECSGSKRVTKILFSQSEKGLYMT